MAKKQITLIGALVTGGIAFVAAKMLLPVQTAAVVATVKAWLPASVGGSSATPDTQPGDYGPNEGPLDPTDPQLQFDTMAYGYMLGGVDYTMFVSLTNHYVALWVPEARWNNLEGLMQGYLNTGVLASLPEPHPAAVAWAG